MFSALDYYKPTPVALPPPPQHQQQPSRRPTAVVSPSLSKSPVRNSGLEAARIKHKERQSNNNKNNNNNNNASSSVQREQPRNDFDEDEYEDATLTEESVAAALAVRKAKEELRLRSRPISPSKIRLGANRSPGMMMADDFVPVDSRRTSTFLLHDDRHDFDNTDDKLFSAGGGIFLSPAPLASSMKPQTAAATRSPSQPMPPPSATSSTSLEMLMEIVPFLSNGFSCTEQDARTLLSAIQVSRTSTSMSNLRHADAQNSADKITTLEAQLQTMAQRLERKDGEMERLRNDVSDARGRYHALEQRFRNAQESNAQRKEESRKHLLCEESKVAKLTLQCKNLQNEVDRLRRMLHENLGAPSISAAVTASAATSGAPRKY